MLYALQNGRQTVVPYSMIGLVYYDVVINRCRKVSATNN